jgi:23S rRNA (guanine745-N1)-methyltransferase
VLICPVCKNLLLKIDKRYVCNNNHSFDIAKQGYINLLLSEQKKSLHPGDNKEMVKSRWQFLNQGYYFPIANQLNHLIEKNLHCLSHENIQIADLGCGIGYYLGALKVALSQKINKKIEYWGIDISKEAILCASSQKDNLTWVVSSNKSLPLQSKSLDIILCIFSPSYFEEIIRVLKSEGRVYIITPGNDHLKELRAMLYEEVNASNGENILQKTQGYLTLEECLPLTFTLPLLSQVDIQNLVKMTPFYWRISPLKQLQISELNELIVTIDIKIWSFKSV